MLGRAAPLRLFPIDLLRNSSTFPDGVAPSGANIINYVQKPPRVIGLWGAILMNLNGAVGAGIFALPALLYAGAGSFAPLSILGFALFYACLIAVPAKLSTLFDQSGGSQLYAQHAFGKFVGFQMGWFVLCANMAGRAANFHVMVAYLAALFPVFGGEVARPLTMVGLIALFTTISLIGTVRSIGAIWIGTIAKLLPLLVLCIAGLWINGAPTQVELPRFSEFEAVALLIAYAFSGAGIATVTAGETTNPRSTIFRSIFINLAGVAIFYALVQWSYIAISPDPSEVDSPLAAAGGELFGQFGILMISLAAVFSIGTNQLNSFVAMPRIAYGMARRGLLPPILAHVSARFNTPDVAIVSYGAIVVAIALSGTFVILATMTMAVEQMNFVIIIASLIVIWRRNDGDIAKTMGLHWFGIVAMAMTLSTWLLLQVPPKAALSTLALVGTGAVLYFLSRRFSEEGEPVHLPE